MVGLYGTAFLIIYGSFRSWYVLYYLWDLRLWSGVSAAGRHSLWSRRLLIVDDVNLAAGCAYYAARGFDRG